MKRPPHTERPTCPAPGPNGPEPVASVDWGDTDPETERYLEFFHGRFYNAFYSDETLRVEDAGEIYDEIIDNRLEATERLDDDTLEELALIEGEIRKDIRGDGPKGINHTDELDVAWCQILRET